MPPCCARRKRLVVGGGGGGGGGWWVGGLELLHVRACVPASTIILFSWNSFIGANFGDTRIIYILSPPPTPLPLLRLRYAYALDGSSKTVRFICALQRGLRLPTLPASGTREPCTVHGHGGALPARPSTRKGTTRVNGPRSDSVANEPCVPIGGRVAHDLLVVAMGLRILGLLQLLQELAWMVSFRHCPAANHHHRLLGLAIHRIRKPPAAAGGHQLLAGSSDTGLARARAPCQTLRATRPAPPIFGT
eukprot:scaffold35093_cov112-Isochrysis_galbana.AAC.1